MDQVHNSLLRSQVRNCKIVDDQNHFRSETLTNTKTTSQRKNLVTDIVWGIFFIIKGPLKQNLLGFFFKVIKTYALQKKISAPKLDLGFGRTLNQHTQTPVY